MSIIERMAKLMEEKELKQAGLANAVNYSRSAVNHWFTKPGNPPAKLLAPIAEYLGVSIHYLCTGEDTPPPSVINAQESPGLPHICRIFNALTPNKKLQLLNYATEMKKNA